MFKSLFIKYISIFMIIIFTSFAILTTVLMSLVGVWEKQDSYASLQNVASAMSVYVAKDFKDNHEITTEEHYVIRDEEFEAVMRLISAENPGCLLFVVNTSGKLCALGSSDEGITDTFFSGEIESVMIPQEILETVIVNGHTTGEGDMEGVLSGTARYVGVSVVSGGETFGALFVATKEVTSNAIADSMIKTLIISTLWIMLASLIAVYIISDRLTRSLKAMSEASKEFSIGNFDYRIDVKGNDEIAELGHSFNQMAEALSGMEQMRRTFVSSVSHELRTPMTTIGGFVDSIRDGAIPKEEQGYYLDLISSEVKRLSRLISSLLQISRLEAGKAQLNLEPFDICELTRLVLISNEQRIDEMELEVEFESDEDNMVVVADRDFIHQVLYNLCDNAIKFSKPGGKYIVSIKKVPGKLVQISVYNEGEGIKTEDLPFVFERFYKSDKSRGLDKSGVGLGLYIVKFIINNHGQTIKAESEEGKWTRFTFTLPMKQDKSSNQQNIKSLNQ